MQQALDVYHIVNFSGFVVAAIVFAFFWAREQKQSKSLATLLAAGIIAIGFFLAIITHGWALTFAAAGAAGYVVRRKGRSRAWFMSVLIFGPLLLVVLLCLPRLSVRGRIPFLPSYAERLDKSFLMPIEDIRILPSMLPTFLPPQGTIAAGRVERGRVKVGQEVEVVGLRPEPLKRVVASITGYYQSLDEGWAGDSIAVVLKWTQTEKLERGMVLATPGSIQAHTQFAADLHVLTKEEGGRGTPFLRESMLQFSFRKADVTGSAKLPQGMEMVTPGNNVNLQVELTTPIALEKGLQFAVREGGNSIGNGTVTDIPQ